MICGLVLAAGAGVRFGREPKLLSELDGRPLLEHAVGAMCAVAELQRVAVVLGAHAPEIAARAELGRAEAVVCAAWAEGLAASLRCGLGVLTGAERVVIALGDGPTLTPDVIRRVLRVPGGVRAVYGGRPGHPVVLGPEQLAQVSALAGDAGARRLLGTAALVECGDLATGEDIDTKTDLEEMRRATRAIA